jgi:MSHA biogenesis protein MshG
MAYYQYRVRDSSGKVVNGTMEATSEDAVADILGKGGYTIITISPGSPPSASKSISFLKRFSRVKPQELAVFTRQLSSLISAGIPIIRALGSICQETENSFFKETIESVILDVEGGGSLSASLKKHPQCFTDIYVNLVRAGETSGNLDVILERLATLGEYEERTKAKIRTATRYPIFVTTALGIAFLVLTMGVLPRFAKIYERFETGLPVPTRILLGINHVLSNYWYVVLLVIGALVFLFITYISTPHGRLQFDRLTLKLPVFGELTTKIVLSRFARISGIMLGSGVPILSVLELSADSSGNAEVSQVVRRIKNELDQGKSMAEAMRKYSLFSSIIIQMVALGEETGKMDELLIKVSDYYDMQVDMQIENLTSLLEPMLILILAGGVLVMALSVFLPMWNLMTLFRNR